MNTIGKKIGYAAIGIAVIGGGVFIYNVNHPAPAATVQGDATSPIATAIQEVASGKANLLDVRTPAEYASGHAKNAVNLDSVDVQAGKMPDLPKDAKIYLYCHSGRRAGIVLGILQQNGYTNVTSLGALQDWVNAGGPKA